MPKIRKKYPLKVTLNVLKLNKKRKRVGTVEDYHKIKLNTF